MAKKRKRIIGLPPGTAVYTGLVNDSPIAVNYVEYLEEFYREELNINTEQIVLHQSDVNKVQWYDIRGLHDMDLINKIAKTFNMHPLATEDAIDVRQRPSYTEHKDSLLISLKALTYNKQSKSVERETVAVYFGEGFVLTFQEHKEDLFAEVRDRIKHSKGRIRSKKMDYLAYALVDYLVDNYYTILDEIEEEIEILEEGIMLATSSVEKSNIFAVKKELIKVRKSVAPLREAVNSFSRTTSTLIEENTSIFIRDLYDHTIHIIDNADSLRDILSGLQDLHLSEISMKMNKIMQFLTIVTALFVPISFLTGLYGMNFEYIPELKYKNGYFVLWAAMIISVLAMLRYFWKKKWL